jgi:hypothetical protein
MDANGNGKRKEILGQMPRKVTPEALSALAKSHNLKTMRAVFGPLTSYLTVVRDIVRHNGGKAYAVFDQGVPYDNLHTLQSRKRVLGKLRVEKIESEDDAEDRGVYVTYRGFPVNDAETRNRVYEYFWEGRKVLVHASGADPIWVWRRPSAPAH